MAAIGAIHTAADAITRTATADQQAVQAAAGASHLYLPTRLLPDDCDTPRRYTPVPLSLAKEMLASYRTAVQTSTALTALLDNLAATVGAPTVILAQARQATALNGQPQPPQPKADVTTNRDHLPQAEPDTDPAPAYPGRKQVQAVNHSGRADKIRPDPPAS